MGGEGMKTAECRGCPVMMISGREVEEEICGVGVERSLGGEERSAKSHNSRVQVEGEVEVAVVKKEPVEEVQVEVAFPSLHLPLLQCNTQMRVGICLTKRNCRRGGMKYSRLKPFRVLEVEEGRVDLQVKWEEEREVWVEMKADKAIQTRHLPAVLLTFGMERGWKEPLPCPCRWEEEGKEEGKETSLHLSKVAVFLPSPSLCRAHTPHCRWAVVVKARKEEGWEEAVVVYLLQAGWVEHLPCIPLPASFLPTWVAVCQKEYLLEVWMGRMGRVCQK
mmetsp:Transcript_4285/g.8580  ORF Transcript_4285/g.8580 Transcript_4285/m.8580 type:complete len:277 (-) Transcript_4285:494-1324(-)